MPLPGDDECRGRGRQSRDSLPTGRRSGLSLAITSSALSADMVLLRARAAPPRATLGAPCLRCGRPVTPTNGSWHPIQNGGDNGG